MVVESFLWVLNLSDGMSSVLEIAERAKLAYGHILVEVHLLAEHGLLKRT